MSAALPSPAAFAPLPRALDSSRRARDFDDAMPEAVVASSRTLGWSTVRACEARHAHGEFALPAFSSHLVVLHVGAGRRLVARAGAARYDGPVAANAVSVVPAGTPSTWRFDGRSPHDAFYVFVPVETVRAASSACGLDVELVSIEASFAAEDAQLAHVAMSLRCELGEAHVVGGQFADSLAPAIAVQLVKRYSVLRGAHLLRGGMAPRKLRRALELIDERLDVGEGIALAEVAGAIDMSYYHFFRAFKQSMGVSPNQWIVGRRVERAKRLLAGTRLSIAEVALRVGFASQSHFSTTFRRLAGATPRTYRTLQ